MNVNVNVEVPVMSDLFKDEVIAEYVSSNDIVAVFEAQWVRDHYEKHHYHGTQQHWFWELRDTVLLELRLNGTVLRLDADVPTDFPMPAILAAMTTKAVRDEIELVGPKARRIAS